METTLAAPISSGEPANGSRSSTTRSATEPFLPEQAIDLETAFAAYTSGSAWLNHRDDAGTVQPGAVADLVLLDRDPFDAPDEIGAARVERVWIGGEVVAGG